jgi:FlaA1/EpsC-like NDP-sugar epimerase
MCVQRAFGSRTDQESHRTRRSSRRNPHIKVLPAVSTLIDEIVDVADSRDAEVILQLFNERKPEVVFHAAALKHLPLLEMYPAEAIKSNVYGTLNILDAADKQVDLLSSWCATPAGAS